MKGVFRVESIPFFLKISSLALLLCIVIMLIDAIRRRRHSHIIVCCIMGIIALALYPAASPPEEIPLSEQPAFIQEQMNVADWYNSYKKILDQLNSNWYQYNKTVTAFANDEISVQTAHIRITELYLSSSEIKNQLLLLHIPENLSDHNHNLVLSIIHKTDAYIQTQQKIFEQSVYATDAANTQMYPQHAEQVYNLQKIMIIENPLTLDIIEDIAALKDNLR